MCCKIDIFDRRCHKAVLTAIEVIFATSETGYMAGFKRFGRLG